MVQGTASHVGKSMLVTALCRIFRQDGFSVAPFKAQNMSNNSYVTPEGGEIGRAQATQAEAAGIEPAVEMNPILLKPEADDRSQVVVLGKPLRSFDAVEYYGTVPELWEVVSRSLDDLRRQYDIVVIEGAGSPAEINLKSTDIVNMRVAIHADAPVLLAGDIDRGGVFASLVGTLELLEPEERARVRAFVINKFRGDISLLTPGLVWLEERTGIPVAGVVPYYHDIHIAEEDSIPPEERRRLRSQTGYVLDIAVMGFPHISNFDEFDPLIRQEGVRLRYVEAGDSLAGPDMVILPGSKSTVSDLLWLRRHGFAEEIRALAQGGTPVFGICGGFQMLGACILDPDHVEGPQEGTEGLGLLPVVTVFDPSKETHRVRADVVGASGILAGAGGLAIEGYEIHMGRTSRWDRPTGAPAYPLPQGEPSAAGPEGNRLPNPFFIRERSGLGCERPDGAMDSGGRVLGTYIHGLFQNRDFRKGILQRLAHWKGCTLPSGADPVGGPECDAVDEEYDKLAALVRRSLDMQLIYGLIGVDAPVT